jgi:carboxypeptidase Q
VLTLLAPLGPMRLGTGGGGADLGPMAAQGVVDIGLDVEMDRYFDLHHSAADTLDKVDPVELRRCTAALAVLAYVLADMPDRLGE